MFAKCSAIVLAFTLLAWGAAKCPADVRLDGPICIEASDSVCSISVGELRGRAERVRFTTGEDGTASLLLDRKATITIGNFRASAEKIDLVQSADEEITVRLERTVRVEMEEFRAQADRAEVGSAAGGIHLMAGEGRCVRLEKGSGENVMCIEAQSIHFDGESAIKASDSVRIKTQ